MRALKGAFVYFVQTGSRLIRVAVLRGEENHKAGLTVFSVSSHGNNKNGP